MGLSEPDNARVARCLEEKASHLDGEAASSWPKPRAGRASVGTTVRLSPPKAANSACGAPLAALDGASARRRALGVHIDGVERLARRHEQAVPLGTAEADVAADLRQPDATDQLAFRRPHRDPAVADRTAGVARRPEIAIDVGAHPVGPAFDAVDHAIAEQLAV